MKEKIGIIGFGNMGSCIAGRLASLSEISVFDKDRIKTANAKGLRVCSGIKELVAAAEILILAVKPQDIDTVLKEIRAQIKGQLIISIAAGISTQHIEKMLGQVRVIRAMPNLGVRISESVTCLSKGSFAQDDDLQLAEELFYYLGVTKVIDEGLMNAATAICGSGPAYIFDFIESGSLEPEHIAEHTRHDLIRRLEKAAEEIGFNHEDATFLAANTVNSSINLLNKTKIPASELKKQVSSKGGTTEAALAAIGRSGSWDDAAKAALRRAEELSKRG